MRQSDLGLTHWFTPLDSAAQTFGWMSANIEAEITMQE